MKNKVTLAFMIFWLFIFIGCEKPNNHKTVYYNLTQKTRDYTVFPVNSYWIYYDSLSGVKDSIHILSVSQGYYKPSENNDMFEEVFSSCFSSFSGSYPGRTSIVETGNLRSAYYDNSILKFEDYEPTGWCGTSDIFEFSLDSLIVRNKVYHDVKGFHVPLDSAYYYFARYIGLIKEKTKTGVKELDHYYISN